MTVPSRPNHLELATLLSTRLAIEMSNERVRCEWPAMDIPLTRSALDAQTILDPPREPQVIFSDDDLADWPDDEGGGQSVAFAR